MQAQQITDLSKVYQPHWGQELVHKSNKRIKVLNWGRRSGKGVCAAYECLYVINLLSKIERPEIMVPRYRMWVVGPAYPQLDQAWEEIDHLLAKVPLETRPPLIDEKTRFLLNDGRLQFKSADNPRCHDDQTEVLTLDGWLPFERLTPQHRVATLNPGSGCLEYQSPTAIVQEHYEGNMIRIKSRSLDMLVTPSHRIWGVSEKGHKGFRQAGELAGLKCPSHLIPKQSKWQGRSPTHFTLLEVKKQDRRRIIELPSVTVAIEDWLAFLGIWLAEGHVEGSKRGKRESYRVGLTQTKSHIVKDIISLLDRLPFQWVNHDKAFVINDKRLWAYLSLLGNQQERYIPTEIKELSPDLLQILWRWMLKGDGTETGSHITYFTTSERLADDAQEILLKMGQSGAILERPAGTWHIKGQRGPQRELFKVSVRKTKHHMLFGKKGSFLTRVPYKGTVYCCQVENGIIYTRRNGRAVWGGNSLQNVALDWVWI